MVKTVLALCFESTFARVENDSTSHAFCARLVESLWSFIFCERSLRVLTWSRNVCFETCSEKCLIHVEPRRCCFETNSFSTHHFKVLGSDLVCPAFISIKVCDLLVSPKDYFIVHFEFLVTRTSLNDSLFVVL